MNIEDTKISTITNDNNISSSNKQTVLKLINDYVSNGKKDDFYTLQDIISENSSLPSLRPVQINNNKDNNNKDNNNNLESSITSFPGTIASVTSLFEDELEELRGASGEVFNVIQMDYLRDILSCDQYSKISRR
jgi:hypothetical protein